MGEICEVGGGQCPCKENYDGPGCNKCADGYWNFPECERNYIFNISFTNILYHLVDKFSYSHNKYVLSS